MLFQTDAFPLPSVFLTCIFVSSTLVSVVEALEVAFGYSSQVFKSLEENFSDMNFYCFVVKCAGAAE